MKAMAPTVRYSGSPLPYSFSEANHTKGGLLVTTAGGEVSGMLDPIALNHYLNFHAVVPAPRTLLADVEKLPPASWMRIDADGLAQMIPAARQDSVIVLPLPAKDGAARSVIAGTPAFGVAVSRACWQDDARCEAAVSLITKMIAESGLAAPAGGALAQSIAQMTKNAQDCAGLLYDSNPDGFDSWAESVIAQLMEL